MHATTTFIGPNTCRDWPMTLCIYQQAVLCKFIDTIQTWTAPSLLVQKIRTGSTPSGLVRKQKAHFNCLLNQIITNSTKKYNNVIGHIDFHILMEVHVYFKICLCSDNRLGDVPTCSSKYICVVRIGFEVAEKCLCSNNRVCGLDPNYSLDSSQPITLWSEKGCDTNPFMFPSR